MLACAYDIQCNKYNTIYGFLHISNGSFILSYRSTYNVAFLFIPVHQEIYMKKVLLGLVVIGAALIPSVSLPENRVVNYGEPQWAGGGNCTYANGIVRSCPDPMMYNNGMAQSTVAPEQNAPPVQAPPVAPISPVDPSDPATPITAPVAHNPVPAQAVTAPPTPSVDSDQGHTLTSFATP